MLAQKITLIVVLSVLFTGCQHDQERRIEEQRRAAQKDQDIRTARKECADTLDAENNKLNVDYQKCVQPKIRRIFLENDNPRDTDIFDLLMAKNMLIASRIDAGKITKEEAKVEFHEASLQFDNERRRRAQIEYNMRMESLRDRPTTTNCRKTYSGNISCTTY
jgi:hypothetical protein